MMAHSGSPGRAIPPFRVLEPHRPISLREIMERFKPKVLLLATSSLNMWIVAAPIEFEPAKAIETLKLLAKECRAIGLPVTLKAVTRATNLLVKTEKMDDDFKDHCRIILGRPHDELDSIYLLALTPRQSDCYRRRY